jgi:uncharacterized protein YlaI
MVMPPNEMTFSCPDCGEQTSYKTHSFPGQVAERLSTIARSVSSLEIKIDIDSSDFCKKCSKHEKSPPVLRFSTNCYECNKKFTWQAQNISDLEQLRFLFIKFPITEVNLGHTSTGKVNPKKLANYISERFFCENCLKKLALK